MNYPTLKLGSKGSIVESVKRTLHAIGYYYPWEDGFGVMMFESVAEFQRKRGITVDGVFGAESWNELLHSRH